MAIKVHQEKLATNVAMPVSVIETTTTFHAFIYHQMREALQWIIAGKLKPKIDE